MRNILVITLLIFCVLIGSSVAEKSIFYENFEDNDFTNNPVGMLIRGGNVYVKNGVLHSDGTISDSSGRYMTTLIYDVNISTKRKISLSFSGLLKSHGNPQIGRGIHLVYGNPTIGKQYLLSMANGNTNSFPYNKYSIIFIEQYDINIVEYIKTNFTPIYDVWYKIDLVREEGIWTMYVNNNLISNHLDNLNSNIISPLIVEFTGSVAIDNISITTDDGLPEETTLEKYAPVFYMHPNEGYTPVDVSGFTENSDLVGPDRIIKNAPSHIEDVPDYENSGSLFFDLTSVDIDTYHAFADNGLFESYIPKVYGRETEDALGFKHLQYFVFYPFQNWYLMNHEGDWELVQVTVNPADQIESVQYFSNSFKTAYYDMEMISVINDTHPVVLVGLGSHNNYADTEEIDLSEDYEFFRKFLYDLKGLDKVSKDGSVYVPMPIAEEGIPYGVEEINGVSDIAKFKGQWGQKTQYYLKNGPKGPRYNPRFRQNWRDPETFSYAPEIPFISFFIYSPVDATISGNGEVIGFGSEKVLLYTGADEEPEAGVITGYENYTLHLTCKETGQFTLKLYYFNNETGHGLMTTYNNVTCSGSGKGKIDASEESDFILYMDHDGNGDFMFPVLPSENVTYNFTYSLPDTDKDFVPDAVDNCIGVANSGQEDTDNDKRGDICDEDDDNDFINDNEDICALIFGDYCNGCPMPQCAGCAISYCPDLLAPVCAPGGCNATICQEDSCYLGGCTEEQYAVFPEKTDNICIVTEDNGVCTKNVCTAICAYDKGCDLDEDNDTINDDTDNCADIYNPDQTDFNSDGKGDICDNPKYYKIAALDAIRQLKPAKQKEALMLRIAEKAIEDSLKEKYWDGNLVVLDDEVFTEELVAASHMRNHPAIAQKLALADSEVVQYLLLTNKNARHYLHAKSFNQAANFLAKRGEYGLSIFFYKAAWHILNESH